MFHPRTLLELNVSECGGTDAAFRTVAKAIEANDTLGCILYDRNHLSVDVLEEIEYSMGRPKQSIRVLLEKVNMTYAALSACPVDMTTCGVTASTLTIFL